MQNVLQKILTSGAGKGSFVCLYGGSVGLLLATPAIAFLNVMSKCKRRQTTAEPKGQKENC